MALKVPKIDSLVLCIAGQCNLACSYCFAKEDLCEQNPKLMTRETAYNSADFLINQLKIAKKKDGNLTFFGGEPLLNWRVIEATVKYVERKNKAEGLNISFSLNTNGVLLNEKIVSFLRAHNFSTTISIDSHDKKIHNYLRPAKKPTDNFSKILKSLQLFRTGDQLFIRATITRKNPYVFQLVNFFSRFKAIKNIYWGMLISQDKNLALRSRDLRIFKRELFSYVDHIAKNWQQGKVIAVHNFFDSLMEMVANPGAYKTPSYCEGGRNHVSISTAGNIYSCECLTGIEKFYLGNILGGIDHQRRKTLLEELDIRHKKECLSCRYKNICGAGCYFASYVFTGAVNCCDKESCEFIKIKFRAAEKLLRCGSGNHLRLFSLLSNS